MTLALPALLIVLWVATQPGFSANDGSPPGGEVLGHFRYTVELEVDGKPVTLSRVILCTGEYFQSSGGARNIASYASPGVIGAFTGDNQAIYAKTPDVCTWIAGISGAKPLHPNYVPIIVRAPDATEFDDMEVIVSRRLLESGEHGVRFISARVEKATEADFNASEDAAKGGPDLSALVMPFQVCPRPLNLMALSVPAVSHALIIPKDIWSRLPEAVAWVETLPAASEDAFRIPGEVGEALRLRSPQYSVYFDQMVAIGYGSSLPESLPADGEEEELSLEVVHPAYIRGQFLSVDRRRHGLLGAQRLTRALQRQKANLTRNAYSELIPYPARSDDRTTDVAVFGRIVFIPADQEMLYLHSETILFGGRTGEIPLEGAVRHDYCN